MKKCNLCQCQEDIYRNCRVPEGYFDIEIKYTGTRPKVELCKSKIKKRYIDKTTGEIVKARKWNGKYNSDIYEFTYMNDNESYCMMCNTNEPHGLLLSNSKVVCPGDYIVEYIGRVDSFKPYVFKDRFKKIKFEYDCKCKK